MNKIFLAVSLAITVIMGVVLADTLLNPANAAGCSTSNVAKCGVWSVSEMRNAYNKDTTPGLKNIFHGMGISGDMVNKSTVKVGTVGKDGNIIVGGKVVGTNAVSAGRTVMSHTKERVKHEKNGTVYYSSPTYDSFRSTKLDAYVFFDADGRFQAAVIKECGNPVKGKPTQPEKPKEQPKKIEVCRLSDKKYPVTIDEKDFDKTKYSKNPEDCKEKEQPKKIEVCRLSDKKYPVTIDEKDFDKTKYSKNPEDCKEKEQPKKIEVCRLSDKKYPVTIDEKDFDKTKYSKNPEDCKEKEQPKKIEVCRLSDKKYPVTIDEKDFDKTKYSKNPEDCKEKEQPKKIEVCRLSDKKYPVTIDEKDFDKTKYSKNPEDCKEKEQPKTMVVCVLETKEYPKTINEADFDKSKHSENADDCKDKEVPSVVELPQTGVADGLISALGVGSMVTAGVAYLASRRVL